MRAVPTEIRRPDRRAGEISRARVTHSRLRPGRETCVTVITLGPGYAGAVPKRRLDTLLAERGLYETRSRAAAAVLAGDVRLGSDGRRADKPGQMVGDDVRVSVAEAPPFVSRGGIKLANGLDASGIDPSGRHCLDVGAATGGFTDCLLQRGAVAVVALDVAYGELHWTLRQDPRVTVLERRNARSVGPAELPFAPDLVVVDVSFISLAKVLGAVLACAAPRFDCLALVKPQFEVGRERVGKGGVVRSADDRREALTAVGETAIHRLGLTVLGYTPSGLPGPAGNRESFIWLAEAGREGGVDDLENAARRAEQ
jgi:23S rRNA (cytidine1920-2'-O)/16S rRNA (cytidine1409-2'-O)-methyltransferase